MTLQFVCMFLHILSTDGEVVFIQASKPATLTASTMRDAAKKAFAMTKLDPVPAYVAIKTAAGNKKVFDGDLDTVNYDRIEFHQTTSCQGEDEQDDRSVCAQCGAKFRGETCPAPHNRMNRVTELKCLGVWQLIDGVNTKIDCNVVSKRTVAKHVEHNNRCDKHSVIYKAEQERIAKAKAKKA